MSTEPSTIAAALDLFELENRARRYTPATLDFYAWRLRPFAAWCTTRGVTRLADVTPALLRAYLVHLQERNLATHTVHGHARALRAWLRFCVREELLLQSPMAKVAMPKLPKRILPALTLDDVRRLVAACETERDHAAILFLLDTGVRAAEFVALNGGDVDLKLGTVRVVQGKGRKDRTTYLGARAAKQLARYYLEAGAPAPRGPIWRNLRTGDRLTTSGLRRLLLRLGDAAEVEHCSPHTFRRTCALWSLRAGMSIYHLQRLLGHEDITVLRRYLPLAEQDVAAAHAKYGAVDSLLGGTPRHPRDRGPPGGEFEEGHALLLCRLARAPGHK